MSHLGPSWLSCLSVLKNYHSSEFDWIHLTLLLLFCWEWASPPSLTKRPRSQTKICFVKVLKIRDLYLQTVLMHDTWTVSYLSEVLFLAIPIPSRFPSTPLVLPASVAQLDAPSNWRPGGRRFNPRRVRQHSFLEIDREIFSVVILSLPLIQEGQLSVSGERMCTILVNRLED